ncbi:MAG: tetratricopeptide repeat protein [Candidatus Hodarchaeales archaeon]|jgi:tetratricopeptide (TPR) repeat protein
MTTLGDNNLFRRIDWKNDYYQVIQSVEDYFQWDDHNPPPIIDLCSVLDFLQERETLQQVFKLIKEYSLNLESTNLELHKKMQPWVDFVKFLATYELDFMKLDEKTINELLDDPKNQHPWLHEGLKWLQTKNYYTSGKDIGLIFESGPLAHKFRHNWWKWQIVLIYAKQLRKQGDWNNLKDHMVQLELLTEQSKFRICYPAIWNMQGNLSISQGNLDEALQFYEKAIQDAQELNIRSLTYSIHNNLGIIYHNLGHYDLADKHIKIALDNDQSDLNQAMHLCNLGLNSFTMGDIKNSLIFYQKANKILIHVEPVNATGYLNMGLGLHKAAKGNTKDALELFNKAFNIFEKFSNILAEVYLHGIIGRIFYDNGEIDLATNHFEKFLEYLNRTQSYQNFYPHYCSYFLFLIDLKKPELIRQHLDKLQIIASTYPKNSLITNWFNFILGVYQYEQFNFNMAQERIEKVLVNTEKGGPIELTLRSRIFLAELHLRKYMIFGDNSQLEIVEKLIKEADDICSVNPIFPLISYIKIYEAMLARFQDAPNHVVDKFLVEAQIHLKSSGFEQVLKNKFQAMIDQINNQRFITADLSSSLMIALRLGTGRQYFRRHFQQDELGIVFWKFTPNGIIPVAEIIPEKLIPPTLSSFSAIMGPMFFTLIGQGDRYHEGIYGPLPVPGAMVNCLLISKVHIDSSQEDNRLENRNYVLIGLLYPEKDEFDRSLIQELIKQWWEGIDDIAKFSQVQLEELYDLLINSVIKLAR